MNHTASQPDTHGEPGPEALRAARRSALTEASALLLPAIPFGFVVGVAIQESPMPVAVGFASSLVVFAGAAQLAMITLLGTASVWAAGLAAVVINSRHIMYSAAMAPAFKHQPRWFRWLAPTMLIDQVFALSFQRVGDHPTVFRRYYSVAAAVAITFWLSATAAGLVFGTFIPQAWQLGYAPAVMFTGLIVMGLDRRPAVVAAVVGAGVCFALLGLPNRVGLLIGALCGVVAGLVVDVATTATEEPS